MAQKEIWQTHEFEDFKFKKRYQISNLGRVMSSIDSPKKDGIILKQKEIKGVKAIGLKFYNTSKSYFIHKLVAMHFCKQPSPEHCYVIHLDQNKSNKLCFDACSNCSRMESSAFQLNLAASEATGAPPAVDMMIQFCHFDLGSRSNK